MKTIKTIVLAAAFVGVLSSPILAEEKKPLVEKPKVTLNTKQAKPIKTYGNKIPEAYAGISKRK